MDVKMHQEGKVLVCVLQWLKFKTAYTCPK